MPQSKKSDSDKMTDYEKERMKRIEENKARMKAMGLDKLASSFIASVPAPISQNQNKKGKRKLGLEDDDEYQPSVDDQESSSSAESDADSDDSDDDEFSVKVEKKVYFFDAGKC